MATAVAKPLSALQDKPKQELNVNAGVSYQSTIDRYYQEVERRQLPEANGSSDAIECVWI